MYSIVPWLSFYLLKKSRIICVSSMEKNVLKHFDTFDILLFFINIKSISKQSIKRCNDTGSPCHAPFSSLKYFVVIPPFITQDSWSFKNIFMQSIKVLLNPNFPRALIRKVWLSESKAFSMSVFTKYPFTFTFCSNTE